jgi:hypothetical protein
VIYTARRPEDLLLALRYWTTVAPYRDFPAKTIAWRLAPAYASGRLLMLAHDRKVVGFTTWAWMTDAEFKTRKYDGRDVFRRERPKNEAQYSGADDNFGPAWRLVVVDCVISDAVGALSREVREYFRAAFPDARRVYGHRGRRDGYFHI